MKIYRIDTPWEKKEVLDRLGCDKTGSEIMARKMETHLFVIRDLKAGAANILKQDALASGADLALPAGAVVCRQERFDAVLMGTKRELQALARREKIQPFGLRELSVRLEEFLKERRYEPRIMGVVNANDDSFYPGSRYRESAAVEAIGRMIEEGARIVDIGGVSSRPGSEPVSAEEEMARLKPILDTIRSESLAKEADFSIDSYTPEVVAYALACGFSIVNDITGLRNETLGKLARDHGAKMVLMHMQGTPRTMQKNPSYDHVVLDVDRFFEERIERAERIGLAREDLILDVGIGFGKSLEHNLTLLRNHATFLRHACELLIGASRKSMIDRIIPTPTEARLPGTLAIHLKAVENGATIVRCHDVAEHRQALAVWEAMGKTV